MLYLKVVAMGKGLVSSLFPLTLHMAFNETLWHNYNLMLCALTGRLVLGFAGTRSGL